MQLKYILISSVTTAAAIKATAAARRVRPIPDASIEKLGDDMKKSACINIQADFT